MPSPVNADVGTGKWAERSGNVQVKYNAKGFDAFKVAKSLFTASEVGGSFNTGPKRCACRSRGDYTTAEPLNMSS